MKIIPKKSLGQNFLIDQNIINKIVNIVDIFRAKIVDISDFSTTIEVTGDPGKITTILNILKPYKIIEIVRTGKISIERELGINSEILRSI